MHGEIPQTDSPFKDENAIRWAFLEQESDACAVVSERMELLYLNEAGRALTLPDWFAKRCFEVLPHRDEQCAWHCPTIVAVSEAKEITYCEEALSPTEGSSMTLGTAVIPLHHFAEDRAKALLVFRTKLPGGNDTRFRDRLITDARQLNDKVAAQYD